MEKKFYVNIACNYESFMVFLLIVVINKIDQKQALLVLISLMCEKFM